MKISDLLYKTRKLPKAFTKQLIKQKHLSPSQIAMLTGRTTASVLNLSIPKTHENARKEAVLTRVYPYPIGDYNKGPVFIKNDEKCISFILEHNQLPA